jgi:hypothetical protein
MEAVIIDRMSTADILGYTGPPFRHRELRACQPVADSP